MLHRGRIMLPSRHIMVLRDCIMRVFGMHWAHVMLPWSQVVLHRVRIWHICSICCIWLGSQDPEDWVR